MQTLRILTLSLTTLATVALAAGCSLKQDPYDGQPDEVRNAAPMGPIEKDKKAGDALSKDYLQIQSDDNAAFRENVQGSVDIKGAILTEVNGHEAIPGQDFILAIDNIADFPGAQWDAVNGKFVWTPLPGFVDTNYSRNVHITVSLTAKFGPYKTTKDILAVVTRADMQPTIVSIEDLSRTLIKEGDVRTIKVVVRDPHSAGKSMDTKPRLQVTSDGANASAANLIYCAGGCKDPDQDPNDPQLYTFNLRLDLQGKEITQNKVTLTYGLIATSPFGEASAISTSNLVISSLIQDAQVSWSSADPLTMASGQTNRVNFTVFDPNSDGAIGVTFNTQCSVSLGASANCSCSTLGRPGTSPQLCTITWSVPASPLQTDYTVEFVAKNTSRDGLQTKSTTFQRTLHIERAGPTPPAPGGGPIHTLKPGHGGQ